MCTLDTDGDGIVNALDLDSDGDGVEDANESWTLDHDGDGVVNALDNDSDGDGVLDGVDPSYTRASVTYVGLTMYAGVDIGTWEPTNAGGDGETFVVTPSLPDGLSFDATSGNITGAPTSNQSETTHTVWTNNTGGSNSTSISITVIEPTPSITASVASVVMNVNVNISAITMANAGGVPSSRGGPPCSSHRTDPRRIHGVDLGPSRQASPPRRTRSTPTIRMDRALRV